MGSHGQTKNIQLYSGVTFSGIYTNKMHRDKPSRKNANHVTFPRHTWILHVTVTFQTSHCQYFIIKFHGKFHSSSIAAFDSTAKKPTCGVDSWHFTKFIVSRFAMKTVKFHTHILPRFSQKTVLRPDN